MTFKQLKYTFLRLPIIIRLLFLIGIAMTVYGSFIHFIEPEQFPTIFDGIWWAFVTGATVGYGDYVPTSPLGRAIAVFLVLTGGGLIAFYISSIAGETVRREADLKKGKIKFKGSNHFVFIGWNERTRQLIELTANKFPHRQIVLIDRTTKEISFPNLPVHFIHGDPAEDKTLEKANIHLAEQVLITADHSKSERQADKDTIVATIAIRGNHQTVPIIAEILSKIQIENAMRAGATAIIRSNDFMSTLFFHELSHLKKATPFEDILRILKNERFVHLKLPAEYNGQTFSDASANMMREGYLMLGVLRDNKDYIHPPPSFILKKNDIIISLTPWNK